MRVFLACATQWHRDHLGRLTGINYVALESIMRMLHVEHTTDAFERVQILEVESLAILNR